MTQTDQGLVLEILVKPRAKSFKIQVNDELVVFCRQPPIEGRVNRELIKELSKVFGRKVEIVSGLHSKAKRILVQDATPEEIAKILGE